MDAIRSGNGMGDTEYEEYCYWTGPIHAVENPVRTERDKSRRIQEIEEAYKDHRCVTAPMIQ